MFSESQLGFKPVFILPNNSNNDLKNRFPKDKMTPVYLPIVTLQLSVAAILKYVFFFFRDLLHIRSYLIRNSIDYLYITGGSWQIKGVLAALLARKKPIWHLNDSQMNLLVLKIFQSLSYFVEYYIFASHKTKSLYFPLIKSKDRVTKVIPSSVASKFFADNVPSNDLDGITFGTVANINPIKGLEKSINLFKNLSNSFPGISCSYSIVGPVSNSQKKYFLSLQNIARNDQRISFLGPKHDLENFYDKIQFYICTSISESSPIAVWEAMASGCIIISFPVGDISKYISNRVNGFLINDINDYKFLINDLKNEELINRMRKKAVSTAKNHFQSIACLNSHIQFLNKHNL